VEVLTSTEVASLLRQCSTTAPTGIRNRALITVMYRAGLRVDEALDLRWADVNPANGTIRVLHGKGDEARTVSIDDGGMALVQRWMDARNRLGLGRQPLFCTLAGGKLSDSYVRNMMSRIARKAGIEKRVHPHALRHAHAAELSAEGVPVNVIQQQLGHKHLSTTDVYLRHISPQQVIDMGRNRAPFNPEEL
jgi:site-specific recombinase XerD